MTIKTTISYSEARQNLAGTIKTVVDDSTPVLITSRNRRVVMISEEDFESLNETAYLLSSPENAKRLMAARKEIKEGKAVEIPFSELEAMINQEKA